MHYVALCKLYVRDSMLATCDYLTSIQYSSTIIPSSSTSWMTNYSLVSLASSSVCTRHFCFHWC